MGAWGPGPFDNDSAADAMLDLNHDIAPAVERLLANHGEFGPSLFDVRLAVWLMSRLWVSPYTMPVEGGEALMERGVEALNRYLADEMDPEWAEAMTAERDHLLAVMRGEECPPGLMDRIAEVLS